MVTQKVIKEIYRKYSKPPKNREDLELPRYIELLKKHHSLRLEGDEVINTRLDGMNLFGRILIPRLNAVLEFDNEVAFVFGSHIIFFDKHSDEMRINLKPEKRGLLSRLFSRKDR